jgi:hypothetical protein
MKQRVAHDRVRQLLAARLDGPISRNEYRLVAAHLRTCAQCRLADHDYRAQRAQLRSLSAPIPPRDLWPRTSAALDREVARGRGRFGRRRPAAAFGRQVSRARHSAALAGLLVAIGTITALATFQVVPNLGSDQPGQAALPTPFSVADQQLAFVGGAAENVTVYQTRVNRMCPTGAPDCGADEGITGTPIQLPTGVKPRNVALSPSGNRLVVVGEDVGRDVIAVVLLPNGDNTVAPMSTGGLTPPQVTGASGPPISGAGGDMPSTSTGNGNLQSPQSGDNSPSIPPNAVSPDTSGSSSSNLPPATAVAGLTVLAILDNVHSAGAPPAWSADGSMLAFSAMPADGSHGPDVYVWEPTDTLARPITSDHDSYFASWSGTHIVASRLLNDPSAPAPQVATVVIDPQTLTERVVDGPQMWLPAVNAGSETAVVWYGQLAWNGALPTPGAGSLYLADWSQLDPYATGRAAQSPSPPVPPSASPSQATSAPVPSATVPQPSASLPPESAESPSPSVSPSESARPSLPASLAPASIGVPEAAGSPLEVSPADASPIESAAAESPLVSPPASSEADASPAGTGPISDGTSPDVAQTPAATLPAVLSPLGPSSTFSGTDVTDWQVSWSSDGEVLGVWIADVSGSSWGQLVVLALDPQTGQLSTDPPLVAPTLARRGFTLGLSRVAYVGSSSETPDGELRVRTWGSTGSGDLLLHAPDGQEVVPAF